MGNDCSPCSYVQECRARQPSAETLNYLEELAEGCIGLMLGGYCSVEDQIIDKRDGDTQ